VCSTCALVCLRLASDQILNITKWVKPTKNQILEPKYVTGFEINIDLVITESLGLAAKCLSHVSPFLHLAGAINIALLAVSSCPSLV